jgi:hypothetical protein
LLVGALSFDPGRSFERSGSTAQPAQAAAFGSWGEPGASNDIGSTEPEVVAASSAGEQPTDPTAAWLDEIERQDSVSPFEPPPAQAVAPAAPTGQGAELAVATMDLLTAGRYDAALIWGRALMATEPEDAVGYLCVGAALIDLGRRQEAHETFRACVRRATHGDVSECLAFAGRQ